MNRPHGTMRVGAERDPSRNAVALYLVITAPDGTRYAPSAPLDWIEIDDHAFVQAALHIPHEDAPRVAEAMEGAGYGPQRHARIEGQLTATEAHRDDLRTLLGLGNNAGAEQRITVKVDR